MPILAGTTNDPATQARDANLAMLQALADAATYEQTRDARVRQLRKTDPKRWTYTAIAKAVGISVYRVTKIIKG